MKLLRLVPDETNLPFMSWRRITFPLSGLLSLLAIVLFFTAGLNFGIDFRGGTLIEIQSKAGSADLSAIRTTLGKLDIGEVQLQRFGSPSDVLIRLAQQPGAVKRYCLAEQRLEIGRSCRCDWRSRHQSRLTSTRPTSRGSSHQSQDSGWLRYRRLRHQNEPGIGAPSGV